MTVTRNQRTEVRHFCHSCGQAALADAMPKGLLRLMQRAVATRPDGTPGLLGRCIRTVSTRLFRRRPPEGS